MHLLKNYLKNLKELIKHQYKGRRITNQNILKGGHKGKERKKGRKERRKEREGGRGRDEGSVWCSDF